MGETWVGEVLVGGVWNKKVWVRRDRGGGVGVLMKE